MITTILIVVGIIYVLYTLKEGYKDAREYYHSDQEPHNIPVKSIPSSIYIILVRVAFTWLVAIWIGLTSIKMPRLGKILFPPIKEKE